MEQIWEGRYLKQAGYYTERFVKVLKREAHRLDKAKRIVKQQVGLIILIRNKKRTVTVNCSLHIARCFLGITT